MIIPIHVQREIAGSSYTFFGAGESVTKKVQIMYINDVKKR